jgi:hypothetical protein
MMTVSRARLLTLLAGAAALLAVSVPVFAHHGTAAFDTSHMVTVKGTVTNFEYVNPHVQVYFTVKNDKGMEEAWQGELTAPNKLTRAGWNKHTLSPGDSVTASGFQAKNGEHTLWIRKLIGPDGQEMQLYED